jgi:hypothetical protein
VLIRRSVMAAPQILVLIVQVRVLAAERGGMVHEPERLGALPGIRSHTGDYWSSDDAVLLRSRPRVCREAASSKENVRAS